MGRAVSLALLLVALGALVGAFVAAEARRPVGWEAELEKYVEYRDSLSSGTTTAQLVARASQPWNFSRDMSHASFGDSVYYRTDYGYDAGRGGGPRPLPFPPDEVWCVLLQRDRASTTDSVGEITQEVVFSVLDRDMYNADWVIHEGASAPFSPEFMEDLSLVGCDLALEP